MKTPKYASLMFFSWALLQMIDEGKILSICDVCENIENGTIFNFIDNHYKINKDRKSVV